MGRRPRPVTFIGVLFIATGVFGLLYHAPELDVRHPFANDAAWVLVVRLLAIVGGAFVLRGRNWARWLVMAWMAYHVALSAFHTRSELIVHVVVLALVAWILLRPEVSAYFRGADRGAKTSTTAS